MPDFREQDKPLDDVELHVGPEYAVAEQDVAEVSGEIVAGSTLGRDAWRRLKRSRRPSQIV